MYIVYVTTNIITNKIYFGVHQQEEPYEFDGYLGSGTWRGQKRRYSKTKQSLSDAIKQYGKDNFIRETLFYYWTPKEAYKKESEIVTTEFIKHDWNYNLTVGGKSHGFTVLNNNIKTDFEYAKKTKLKKEKTCLKRYGVDNVVKSKIIYNKIIKTNLKKYGHKSHTLKHFTDKQINFINNLNQNYKTYHIDQQLPFTTIAKIFGFQKDYLSIKFSEASLPNLDYKRREGRITNQYQKTKCPHCKKIGGERIMKRWHFDNCKEGLNNGY